MNRPVWSRREKIRFTFRYAYWKARLLTEVKSPKVAFLWFEIRYSLTNLINTFFPRRLSKVVYKGPTDIVTAGGCFQVRSGTQDAALISPAFERDDLNKLMSVLWSEMRANRRVVFYDVGANIGQFAVRVGLEFRGMGLTTLLFEPIPENLELLKENLRRNGLEASEFQIFPVALSDSAGIGAMSFSRENAGDSKLVQQEDSEASFHIQKVKGDDVLFSGSAADAVVLKIDVEGHEGEVLRGLRSTLARAQKVWLCIEDIYSRDELYELLYELGFAFVQKQTPYNSWWKKTQ